MKLLSLFALLFAPLAYSQTSTNTIWQNVNAMTELSTLASVLDDPRYAAVATALNGTTKFTLFAPNNAAFAAAGIDVNNVDAVTQVLLYHAVPGDIPSSALAATNFVATASNSATYVTLGGDYQTVGVYKNANTGAVTTSFGIPGTNFSTVVNADIASSNGQIHVIDKVENFPVLTSSTASTAGLSTLVSAVARVNLVDDVDNTPNITIFAPTNAAFTAAGGITQFSDAALTTILTYHVVPGRYFSTQLTEGQVLTTLQGEKLTVRLSQGKIEGNRTSGSLSTTDVITKNGVVHVIGGVLLPSTTAFTIADLITQTTELSTLNTVLTSPDYQAVEDALNSAGPFTLFGPNNAAFTAANIDTSAVAAVTQVLLYHAVTGKFLSTDLAAKNFVNGIESESPLVNQRLKQKVNANNIVPFARKAAPVSA